MRFVHASCCHSDLLTGEADCARLQALQRANAAIGELDARQAAAERARQAALAWSGQALVSNSMAGGAGALQGAIEALRAAFLLPQKELRCAPMAHGVLPAPMHVQTAQPGAGQKTLWPAARARCRAGAGSRGVQPRRAAPAQHASFGPFLRSVPHISVSGNKYLFSICTPPTSNYIFTITSDIACRIKRMISGVGTYYLKP